ncbi:hypothetical protein AVEN_15920-1 [Araneus ventricosus]|uniref:Uncharacterized protein n=1 Tax=Araneus ventricosus TaxID=182803 RepID=A0A4Y2QKK9_ARAVE|nr:hypothetical protein AVEN_15920-1 [Araneus ventricosus]
MDLRFLRNLTTELPRVWILEGVQIKLGSLKLFLQLVGGAIGNPLCSLGAFPSLKIAPPSKTSFLSSLYHPEQRRLCVICFPLIPHSSPSLCFHLAAFGCHGSLGGNPKRLCFCRWL